MKKDIQALIAEGESELLEFKTSFGKETMEALSAFANNKGGTVLIGVNNKGKILGVQIMQETIQQWINQIKSSTAPSIIPDAEILEWQKKKVVILQMAPYPVKPISFRGKYYIRKHASNHLMSLEEIANEHLKTVNMSWDFMQQEAKAESLAKRRLKLKRPANRPAMMLRYWSRPAVCLPRLTVRLSRMVIRFIIMHFSLPDRVAGALSNKA